MQAFFNYRPSFISTKVENRTFKILDYIYKTAISASIVVSKAPEVLWLQLPPSPLINLALLYKRVNKKVIIIADCHNGLFDKKWSKYLYKGKYLNKVDLILVHNQRIREAAIKMGIRPDKVLILEDKPAFKTTHLQSQYQLPVRKNWVLMPCSFAEDEPLSTVFEAARRIPHITIVISGDWKRGAGIHDISAPPDNICLTGYLSKNDYEALLRGADAVLGLTTEDDIQLSVANEAVGYEKPMILSDTPLLRELFDKGVVYVDNFDPDLMAAGIEEAVQKKQDLEQDVMLLKKERNLRWGKQAKEVQLAITDLLKTGS